MTYLYLSIIFGILNIFSYQDLHIFGTLMQSESISRLPIACTDMLKDDLSLGFIPTNPFILDYTDIPKHLVTILSKKTDKDAAIGFYYDFSCFHKENPVIPSSKIKLAYSMLESTAIPDFWVKIFNTYFDAIIVPDDFLVPIYTQSGVKKPIFVLPCALYLSEFLNKQPKEKRNKTFIFASSAAIYQRKNFELLINAFQKQFGNNPQVKLLLHIRGGHIDSINRVTTLVKNINNISIIKKKLSHSQYVEFMENIDCFVLLSKGEGFSIIPREALALGIPCILTDNTAHRTICKTGFVRSVVSTILEPAYYEIAKTHIGYNFNCTLADVCLALQDVYDNYQYYLNQAKQGREWVKQYDLNNLKSRYLSLLKPTRITLGDNNQIYPNKLETNSKEFYLKLRSIFNKSS